MQELRDSPRVAPFLFFFALLGFVLGAALGFYFGKAIFISLLILSVIFLGLALKRGHATLLAFLALLSLGALFFHYRPTAPLGEATYQGIVVENKANYFIFQSDLNRFYVYEKDSLREQGDLLQIRGKVALYESTEYESRFSFGEALAQKGVRQSLSAYSINVIWERPFRLRKKEIRFLASFSQEAGALLDSLLFDHRDYGVALIQQASALGCLYFLSSSGVLFGGFLRLISRVLSLKYREREVRMASWIVASLLLPLSFGKIGILRVYILQSVSFFYETRNLKPPSRFSTLSNLGCFMLLLNPFLALSSAFLLGYGLSFALLFSGDVLRRFPGKRRDGATFLFVIAFMLPFLASKASFHLLSLAYSLLLAPLVYPFSFLGFLSFWSLPAPSLLNPFAEGIASFLSFLTPLDLQIPLGDWGESLPFLYYGAFVLFFSASEIGAHRVKKGILFGASVAFLLNIVPFGNAASEQVSFINVGQGDAILLRRGFHALMIDTGGSLSFDMASEVDIPFLRKNRIYHLDGLIVSHGDFDHSGAASSLRQKFRVDHYVDSKDAFPLTVAGISLSNFNVYSGEAENEESLVLAATLMEKKWLFMGDAPVVIEMQIVADHPELDCDILKVGHHGSNTSSSLSFLQTVTPEVGIISVGKKNPYGHPNSEILDRLKALGASIRRTDEEGTITYFRYYQPFQKTSLMIYPVKEEGDFAIMNET
jgi:competence protein ComEC